MTFKQFQEINEASPFADATVTKYVEQIQFELWTMKSIRNSTLQLQATNYLFFGRCGYFILHSNRFLRLESRYAFNCREILLHLIYFIAKFGGIFLCQILATLISCHTAKHVWEWGKIINHLLSFDDPSPKNSLFRHKQFNNFIQGHLDVNLPDKG